MVTVKDYKKRETKEGKEFYVLVLHGNVVPVKSETTGKMYFTAKSCTVSTTFDEETCQQIKGMQFPGQIVKVETEPFNYTIPETGETIQLKHRWEYQDNTLEKVSENVIEESEVY
ncbi:hypothetical protein NYZ99_19565 [Maribacter litopenaei]|uniref:Uncharacterized protein n=1 Tax=Maribacter litopenaei TaxID=2976127 RepID=A0ABY5Y7A6_9FLAO|nr:hypothetical protein [Maribacter litopenaei]UWX54907.1 hypothetical protein NYZ99_19565 [Maribacter litopenaei]